MNRNLMIVIAAGLLLLAGMAIDQDAGSPPATAEIISGLLPGRLV